MKLEMKVEEAYKRSIETVLNWIQNSVNARKTQVFIRTYAPVHFRYVIVSLWLKVEFFFSKNNLNMLKFLDTKFL